MTLRPRSEAARRRQAARRASYPREFFAYPYWVGGWAHPFESRWAAYQKYAWLNNATKPEHSILSLDDFWNYEKKAKLEERLFALVLSEQRAPRIRLWDALALPHAVCQVCLESGYWSELPQLAGYDQCPLHGAPLQRRCRKCLRPLRFGHPRFGQTGAFVCDACGEPLTPYPINACLQWHRMPSENLLSRFAPLHALAQQFATECDGDWKFPWRSRCRERQWILHALTGHRLRQEWEANGTLFRESAVEQVIPVTFILPCDETVLAAQLADSRRALLADVAHHFRQYPAAALPTRGVTEMRMIYLTHELHISAGGALLENVRAVLQWIDEVKQRRTMEDALNSELSTFYSVSPLVRLVPRILLAFSVWQIVRVLLWLDSLIETMTVQLTNADGMTDQIGALLEEQPYEIRLLRGRIKDANFVFELGCQSWIPPCRLRKMTDGIELTIFQIVPQFDGR